MSFVRPPLPPEYSLYTFRKKKKKINTQNQAEIMRYPEDTVQLFSQAEQYYSRTGKLNFMCKTLKSQPYGCARINVRGSPKSVGLIV